MSVNKWLRTDHTIMNLETIYAITSHVQEYICWKTDPPTPPIYYINATNKNKQVSLLFDSLSYTDVKAKINEIYKQLDSFSNIEWLKTDTACLPKNDINAIKSYEYEIWSTSKATQEKYYIIAIMNDDQYFNLGNEISKEGLADEMNKIHEQLQRNK